LCLILLLTITVACPAAEDTPMPPGIQEIKHKYESHLLAMDGVVSVGIGRDAQGGAAIIVGVEDAARVDPAALPQALEGFPVILQVIGSPRAQ